MTTLAPSQPSSTGVAGAGCPLIRAHADAGTPPYESVGDYLVDQIRASRQHNPDPRAKDRVERARRWAEEKDRMLQRAAAHVTTTDVAGVVAPAFTGDLIAVLDAGRPFIEAMERRPLPATGSQVNDPELTQKPLVGKQAAQKTEIASRTVTIGTKQTGVDTYAGYDNVSIQVIERSDGDFIQQLIELFVVEFAAVTDAAAITTALAAPGVATETLPGPTPTAAQWQQALINAAGKVYLNTRVPPELCVMSLDRFTLLAGLTDTTGRLLFPSLINGPMNAPGQLNPARPLEGNIVGLRPVVDPNAPTGTLVVTTSGAFRTRQSDSTPVKVSAVEVGLLGVEIGVYGFVAFTPRRPNGLVKLVTP